MTQASAPRFENVNLLRAIAALTVLTYHVIEHSKWTSFPMEGPLLWFRIGWVGMDLFFAISGFVIAYSALILYRKDPRRFAKDYWLRRITRIVPLYLLTLFAWIAVATNFLEWPDRGWQLFTHLAFIHSFWPETFGSIDGPNWSLAVEMHFYLAIALLIGWIDRTPGWRIWLYSILIAWAWRGTMFLLYGQADNNYLEVVRVDQMPGFLDEFGAGIFLAKMALGERPKRIPPAAWLVAACVTFWVAMATFWPRAGYWEFPFMVTFWHTAFSAFLLCLLGAAISVPQFATSRWLRPLDYLGDISYGIYLWHLFAIQYVILVLGLKELPALLAVMALSILAASVSWRYFEKPFMNLARARRSPRSASASPDESHRTESM